MLLNTDNKLGTVLNAKGWMVTQTAPAHQELTADQTARHLRGNQYSLGGWVGGNLDGWIAYKGPICPVLCWPILSLSLFLTALSLFLEPVKLAPASGPLHLPLTMFFQASAWFAPYFLEVSAQYHFVREALFYYTIYASTPLPLLTHNFLYPLPGFIFLHIICHLHVRWFTQLREEESPESQSTLCSQSRGLSLVGGRGFS